MTLHAYDRRYPKTMPNFEPFSAFPTTFGHIPSNTACLQDSQRRRKAVAKEPSTQELRKPPLPTPSAGVARIPSINEIFYIKSWAISLMLEIRGAINVGQFSALANVNFWRGDLTGNSPQTTVPGIHGQGNTAGQQSKQTKPTTATAISKCIKK